MNQQEEAQAVMIEVCRNIVENFAEKHSIDSLNMNIRIDMESTAGEPVFGLFDKSQGEFRLLERHSLKELINLGADLPPMIRKMIFTPVRDTIAEMFKQAMKLYDAQDSKQVFILLHLQKVAENTAPAISIYMNNDKKDTVLIGVPLGGINANT
jgi:hypothetical protein